MQQLEHLLFDSRAFYGWQRMSRSFQFSRTNSPN